MIKYLEWDSNFFNLKIGKVELNDKSNISLDEIISDKYDLIYVFNYSSFKNKILLNETNIDTKINYSIPLEGFSLRIIKTNLVESKDVFTITEINELIILTIASGVYSRFSIDKKFQNDSFERLYTYWLKSSLDNESKKIFFVKLKNKIIGLLILKLHDEHSIIEILSVSKEYRGQGIASDLVSSAINFSLIKNKKIINVSTQKDNIIACDFYESNGFVKINEIEIFHLWTK